MDAQPAPAPYRHPLNRRHLLGLAVGGAAAVLSGCSTVLTGSTGSTGGVGSRSSGGASCVPRSSMDSHRTLAGLPLVYEIGRRRSSFDFEPDFYGQLEGWLTSYADVSGLAAPDQVWTYGAWTNGGGSCDSWHNAGRAFDLARLRLRGGAFVSCRYDLWKSETGRGLDRSLRQYWALAASLHLHFAYVLTYLYNARHHNHIHVDNSRSGAGRSTLSTRSPTQVQAVQAICTHLWDEPVEITGRWDDATRDATRRVLERAGQGGDLDDDVQSWRAFLTASVPRGGD